MSDSLALGATVLYVNDMPSVVDFYRRALGLEPRLYDEANGFAELGDDGLIAIASHGAGELMMPGAYPQSESGHPAGVELAFYTDDVAAAFDRAVSAGGVALASPREMPWGQTVAYVESVEGTVLGFVTRVSAPESDAPAPSAV